ncbi:MAG: hypothetical protein FVQ81_09570 [Candidatus Glassbacteria bacterium]|nr:hypothetical protein [Candidatus Glassbacteria bacterium]
MVDNPRNAGRSVKPGSLEEFFKYELEILERAFNAGNEGALFEAIMFCFSDNSYGKISTADFLDDQGVILPRWVVEAMVVRQFRYMMDLASTGTGRNAKWASRFRQDMIDYARYDAVLELREHFYLKVKWDDVYDRASELLADTSAAGASDTIRGSYFRVRRRMKKNPLRYKVFKYLRVKGLV